jgi:siroheme synthase
VIEWGTYPAQRTVRGTLGTIAEQTRAADVTGPSLFVVGDVVALGEDLAWRYEEG